MIPTVWSLFFDDRPLPPEALRRIHDHDRMHTLLDRTRVSLDPLLPAAAEHAVGEALRQALDQPVTDVLVAVWRRHPRLAEALGADQEPGALSLFALGEHEVVSTHHPRVDVLGSAGTLVAFEFDMRLELRVQRATLEIDGDGTLVRARMGACGGHGSLRLGDSEIAAFDRGDLGMPETIALGIALTERAPAIAETATAPPSAARPPGRSARPRGPGIGRR